MPNRPYSVRLGDDLVNEIQKRFPDFDKPGQGRDGNSKVLRTLIEQSLGEDPEQALNHELAELREQLRDLKNDLSSIQRNFSTVLQVILRNAGRFDSADVEATIKQLKQKGKIV